MTANTVLITGNTYPVKDQIKALGGRWDADAKGWRVPENKADEARALVAGGSTGTASPAKKFRHTKCVVCGVKQSFNSRGYPNVRIYRSGECQDCFEERKMGY
jgi:hypothetical protein